MMRLPLASAFTPVYRRATAAAMPLLSVHVSAWALLLVVGGHRKARLR